MDISKKNIALGVLGGLVVAFFMFASEEGKKEVQASCHNDPECVGQKHHGEAVWECQKVLENHIKAFNYKWNDSAFQTIFQQTVFDPDNKDILIYAGDLLEVQNPLGNWVQHRYACMYNYKTGKVIFEGTGMEPGRFSR